MRRLCTECQQYYEGGAQRSDFCSKECRQSFNNRRAARGALLYDMTMIEARHPDKFERLGFADTREAMIRRWVAEDIAAGRHRSHKRTRDVQADTYVYRTSVATSQKVHGT